MIDTHCHLFKEYYSNVHDIIGKAVDYNVDIMICNGTNKENNLEVLKLARNNSHVKAAIGFQPEDIDTQTLDDMRLIEDNIDNIVAIGEIGLDYYYSKDTREEQIKVFEKQLEIANKYNKPVIIHTRNAHEDTINALKKYPNVKGVIHCFSEGLEEAREYISLGYKLGIGGILTFKNGGLSDVISNIDIKNIVLETDSPYLAPVPYRGKANEPANIVYIAKKLAEIKNISLEEVEKITTENASSIFDF